MRRKTAFLFSGQGSQYYQMGRELYEQNLAFRSRMEHMDRIARSMLGISVVQALYGPNGKADVFDDIRLTHPAIFMVEFALAKTVVEMGVEPDYVLGASLGTFAALAIADCISAEAALERVIRQALVIERHCPQGGMIAVLGDPRVYEDSPFLQARSVIAGQNFASHFVLSAPHDNLASIENFLGRLGVTHQRLLVRYPFHAPWIDSMRDSLLEVCGVDGIRLSATPVVCCALGGIVREIPNDYFWRVAREEIAFMRVIAQMERSGPFDYLDFGPSGTLATFLRYMLPKHSASRRFSFMTPFGRDSELLASTMAQLGMSEPAGVGAEP